MAEGGGQFAATLRGANTDLGLADLVAPLVYVHLLQQGRDNLPAGLGILGQQYLELLREILGGFGRERRICVSVSATRQEEGAPAIPWSSRVSEGKTWFDVNSTDKAKILDFLKQSKA